MLCRILKKHGYDSTSNFIYFHDEYIKTNETSVSDFYIKFKPQIHPGMYTCVGLAVLLMKRMRALEINFPGLLKSTSLLSCEESVNAAVTSYVQSADGPPQLPLVSAEKEHVMVGVSIELNGRKGILLADPGYHVGRVVTVMLDAEYPHTGIFMQHRSKSILKQFNYYFNKINSNYIEWHERAIRHQKEKSQVSLVYTARPYLTALDVTEKRNIVYSFKSMLKRDTRGNIIAGFYFPLNSNFETASFTIFIGINAKAKYLFSDFINPSEVPMELVENFMLLAKFMQCSNRLIMDTICKLAKILSNESFIREVLDLNTQIRVSCDSRQASITDQANIENAADAAALASTSTITT